MLKYKTAVRRVTILQNSAESYSVVNHPKPKSPGQQKPDRCETFCWELSQSLQFGLSLVQNAESLFCCDKTGT